MIIILLLAIIMVALYLTLDIVSFNEIFAMVSAIQHQEYVMSSSNEANSMMEEGVREGDAT